MPVIIGYSRTPEGEAALERAIIEAGLREAQLIVVHSRKTGEDREVDEIVMYTQRLEQIDKRLEESGVPHVIHDYIRGKEVAEDIIETAVEAEADLIVIGHRPRSRTGKFLLGSTLQDVIMDSPCAVMTVPDRAETAEA
ncbi:MAG: universal stress protein [Acidimicrobiia bacterium]